MSLLATAPTPMVDVKEEYLAVEEVVESGTKVSSAEKEVYEVLNGAMKFTFLVHFIPFRGLLEPM